MGLLVFMLICYGASNIVVFSTIFEKPRDILEKYSPNFLGKLVSCMMCFPFWFGVLTSLVVYSPSMVLLNVTSLPLALFLDGCLTSGSVWLLHTIQESIEK